MDDDDYDRLSSSTDESLYNEIYEEVEREATIEGLEWIFDFEELVDSGYLRSITRYLAGEIGII